MITAFSITDEQIRELSRRTLTAAQHRFCSLALGTSRVESNGDGTFKTHTPTQREIHNARARCAALLNIGADPGNLPLNVVLKALGYTTRKRDGAGLQGKKILLDGVVVHEGTADSTWKWLRKTGQIR